MNNFSVIYIFCEDATCQYLYKSLEQIFWFSQFPILVQKSLEMNKIYMNLSGKFLA